MKDCEDRTEEPIFGHGFGIGTPVGNARSAERVAVVGDDLVRDEFPFRRAVDDHHADTDIGELGGLYDDEGMVAEEVTHGLAGSALNAPGGVEGGDHFGVTESLLKRSGGFRCGGKG